MLDRAEVETWLGLTAAPQAYEGEPVILADADIAELCRTWLAVNSAVKVGVCGECCEYECFVHIDKPFKYEEEAKVRALFGQTVALVPVPVKEGKES